ncbi:MAG: tetratricopeptide repeat-containing sulfotransferase family protein, partial [Gammaproteobacteria bacterium]
MTRKGPLPYRSPATPAAPSLDRMVDAAVRFHQRGQIQRAQELYLTVLQAQPKHDHVLNLLGVLLSQKGDLAEGEKLLRKAIKIDPGVADYHNNLGMILLHRNRLEEAETCFKKATALNPRFTNAWLSLGNVKMYLTRPVEAIEAFQKIIAIDPKHLPALNNLGNLYRAITNYDEALKILNKAVTLKPDFAEGWYNLGMVYRAKENGEQAIECFASAISLKPDYARAWCNLGDCKHSLMGDVDGALQAYDKALEITPGLLIAYLLKADVYQKSGRNEEADSVLREALTLDGTALGAYYKLANAKTSTEEDLRNLQRVLHEPDLTDDQLYNLYNALGRIHEDKKDYENSFSCFLKANAVIRKSYDYQPRETEVLFTRFIEIYTESLIREKGAQGLMDERPVFIVGMPRSGTTLVEQILASHPEVHGAGELKQMKLLLHTLISAVGAGPYPECMLKAEAPAITDLARSYLDFLRKKDPEARRISDKMPYNFMNLGLIAMALPGARIIHCQRHPLDTCLSIFTRGFDRQHFYAHDLTELGVYYR